MTCTCKTPPAAVKSFRIGEFKADVHLHGLFDVHVEWLPAVPVFHRDFTMGQREGYRRHLLAAVLALQEEVTR